MSLISGSVRPTTQPTRSMFAAMASRCSSKQLAVLRILRGDEQLRRGADTRQRLLRRGAIVDGDGNFQRARSEIIVVALERARGGGERRGREQFAAADFLR